MYEKRGTDEYHYSYDSYGHITNIRYYENGGAAKIYYVITNSQGDVIAIYDGNGNQTVWYEYDSWGNLVSITDNTSTQMGTKNPFRYRGYYYDVETGLYYLQSRYYDPEIGRFINADGQISTGNDLTGTNLFSYCGSNPVNRVDYTGQFWNEIWAFVKTAVAEIKKAMGIITPSYAGCIGAAAFDGPLPFGDVVAIAGATLLTVNAIEYGIHQAAQTPAISIPKVEEKAEAIVVPKKPDSSVIFPVNPNNFNPIGLTKIHRTGTKNGALISWMDLPTNTEVFRWDENLNYPNGPHYHIHGTGHYYPGTIVPEPYATIYFPFR